MVSLVKLSKILVLFTGIVSRWDLSARVPVAYAVLVGLKELKM
jgi:hypothetical protein